MIALRIIAAAVLWAGGAALFAPDELWPRCLFVAALVIAAGIGALVRAGIERDEYDPY